MVAPALLLVLLAGCGTKSADPPAPGAHVTSMPPTAQFSARAEVVAGSLRQQGALAQWRTELIVLEPALRMPASTIESEKLAWTTGLVTLGPGVGNTASKATARWADGSREVGVVGAADALRGSSTVGGSACPAEGVDPCPLVVTKAVLGTDTFSTNHGPTTLPVWQFSTQGSSEPVVVVAVRGEDLAPLPTAADSAANPEGIAPVGNIVAAQGTSLTFTAVHIECPPSLTAQVVEFDDVVVVGAVASAKAGDQATGLPSCRELAAVEPVTVQLGQPLGQRPVVSAASGEIVTWSRDGADATGGPTAGPTSVPPAGPDASPAGPNAGSSGGGSPMPPPPFTVRDAPEAFRTDAARVAKALRDDGTLARYLSETVLLQPRVIERGYDTDDQKLAFGNGLISIGPAVTDQPGTATITVDGATRQVTTRGARTTLAEVIASAEGCAAYPELTPCPLVVTKAELGRFDVLTNHGRVSVPVWQYWSDGLSTPYRVVAVDPGQLGTLAPGGGAPGSGPLGGDRGADWLGALDLVGVGERSVTVTMGYGACDTALEAFVHEEADAVVVGGRAQHASGVCTAQLLTAPVQLALQAPLGRRPVLAMTGAILVPAFTPRP